MDYSLLVGIFDHSAAVQNDSEDEWSEDEMDFSGDELRGDSPTSPTSGKYFGNTTKM